MIIFDIFQQNLVLATRWWCWRWRSILGVFGGAVGFNVIITGACRMWFPHGSNRTNKYALWWSLYCHDIFTLPATFIISRSSSFSDFMSLCRYIIREWSRMTEQVVSWTRTNWIKLDYLGLLVPAWSAIHVLTVESFPTDRRATALGIFIALSRAGALLGKLISFFYFTIFDVT